MKRSALRGAAETEESERGDREGDSVGSVREDGRDEADGEGDQAYGSHPDFPISALYSSFGVRL